MALASALSLLALVVITYIPKLTLWLPRTMGLVR
jgi:TRAP-type C4-dicarboxylate transport system permease large subunit